MSFHFMAEGYSLVGIYHILFTDSSVEVERVFTKNVIEIENCSSDLIAFPCSPPIHDKRSFLTKMVKRFITGFEVYFTGENPNAHN